jgi:hypothetical protein
MKRFTNKRNISKKSKTQKLWKMKGCRKSGGSCMCSLFKGGSNTCTQCGGKKYKKRQSGGNSLATWNIGYPWTSNISSWPGVSGVDGQSNYFSLNTYPVDPQTSMVSERSTQLGPAVLTNTPVRNPTCQNGGKRNKSKRGTHKKMNKKGGSGFIAQSLVNSGRNLMYSLGSAYNTYNGYPLSSDPRPYIQSPPTPYIKS